MLALALAVTLLVEGAIQFARIHDKRKKKSKAEWLDVDDESASTIEAASGIGASGDLGSSGPLERPAPVRTSAPAGGSPATTASPLQAPAAGGSLYDDII